MARPVGGIISFMRNGRRLLVKGNLTYGLGTAKRTAVVGLDGPHGFKVERQVPYFEGTITDDGELDLKELFEGTSDQIVAQLENGRTMALNDAWYAGEGSVSVEEGEVSVRFEGLTAALV